MQSYWFWGLYVARRHLGAVFRKALVGARDVDDRDEYLGYRGAVVGLVVSVIFCAVFLRQAGMAPGWVFFFLAALFVLYVGNSKIIAQTGLAYMRTSMSAQAFTMQSLGTENTTPVTVSALGLTYTAICDAYPFIMPSLSHATKLTTPMRASRRRFTLVPTLAALIAFLVSVWYSLLVGYRRGAANAGGGLDSGHWVVASVVNRLRTPIPADPKRATFLGVGAAAGALMTFLQARTAWWPIHPVGLAVAMALPVKYVAFSAFLAWLSKLIVLRVGGVRLYRRFVPFFLGLVVGYCLGVGSGLIVDAVWFPGRGHEIHAW